jgi:hypothetical protein
VEFVSHVLIIACLAAQAQIVINVSKDTFMKILVFLALMTVKHVSTRQYVSPVLQVFMLTV